MDAFLQAFGRENPGSRLIVHTDQGLNSLVVTLELFYQNMEQ